jgi:hypothetical protein
MILTNLVPIAEIILEFQVKIILLLILAAYLLNGYFAIRRHRREKANKKRILFWQQAMQDVNLLTDRKAKVLRKRIAWVLLMIKEDPAIVETAPLFYDRIVKTVLLPSGRKLIQKRDYIKKYYGLECFYYNIETPWDQQDESYLLKAIDHPVLLVSLNAARVIFKHGSVKLLEEVIVHLAQWQWFQQDALASMVLEDRPMLAEALFQCLEDKDFHVRTFCYRLLLLLPFKPRVIKKIGEDLYCNVLDLRLVALDYLTKAKDNIWLRDFMHDADWMVRAKAAYGLGVLQDGGAIELLTEALSDPEWWVRTRSAEALLCLGEKGIEVLQQKSSEPQHKGAYEAANEVLSKHKHPQDRYKA